jgi:hypothetical protein
MKKRASTMALADTNPWAELEALFGDLALEGTDTLATAGDAMREYAHTVGAERTDRAWICTNYDTWIPNPYYDGPEEPHPEDDEAYADLDARRPCRQWAFGAMDVPFRGRLRFGGTASPGSARLDHENRG